MFIIYNSFAIAVTSADRNRHPRARCDARADPPAVSRRERHHRLRRTLGGVAFGILIARGIAASIGGLISDVYGVGKPELATSPALLLVAMAVGVITSVVAAAIPAHPGARVTVHALRREVSGRSAGESRAVAAALLARSDGLPGRPGDASLRRRIPACLHRLYCHRRGPLSLLSLALARAIRPVLSGFAR